MLKPPAAILELKKLQVMQLRKLLNRVKMARTIIQMEKITKDAYEVLSNGDFAQLDQAIQNKISSETKMRYR